MAQELHVCTYTMYKSTLLYACGWVVMIVINTYNVILYYTCSMQISAHAKVYVLAVRLVKIMPKLLLVSAT